MSGLSSAGGGLAGFPAGGLAVPDAWAGVSGAGGAAGFAGAGDSAGTGGDAFTSWATRLGRSAMAAGAATTVPAASTSQYVGVTWTP